RTLIDLPDDRYSSTASRRNCGGYGLRFGFVSDTMHILPARTAPSRPNAQVSTKAGEVHCSSSRTNVMKDGDAATRRPPRAERLGADRQRSDAQEAWMQFLGIDWGTRKAAWCSLDEHGHMVGEGYIPADQDGLARLVVNLRPG